MRYWEFLIQQEGDQTWLPLETRQVEILEGRYRMAAHTSYDSTSVEIRVSQLLLDEIPPRRRVRKRKASTNDSGLLAIFPFIQLSPGRWEIDCNSPDVIDDFLGEGGWHYSVQLQVTPRDDDDWEPDWPESMVQRPLDMETEGDTPGIQSAIATDESSQAADFKLQLKQQAYATELGQALTLMGYLSQTTANGLLTDGQLLVELRDPQTASTVKEMAFDVPKLPAPFSFTITLPDELSTQVILGSISLVSRERPEPLASASFTVTIGLAQMLDAIANQPNLDFEEEISIFPGSTEAFVPPPEKSEVLLTNESPLLPKEIIPSEGMILPPQIKPTTDPDPDRQPELPTFSTETGSSQDNVAETKIPPATHKEDNEEPQTDEGNVADAIVEFDLDNFVVDDPDDLAVIAESSEMGSADTDADTGRISEKDEPLPFSQPKVYRSIEDDDLDLELATAALEEDAAPDASLIATDGPDIEPLDPPDEAEPTDHQWNPATVNIDQAFQKLQLRERFWQKLSLLTQDGYRQSLEVKRALQPSDTLPDNQQSNEFVAYEQLPMRPQWSSRDTAKETTEPIQVSPPMLDVPDQELVSGEWIAIKVRLPAGDYQPYVKVWMNDLQTRTRIDAPRLLMQFIPNDHNELETLMRIQVPNGCLELQFAAISIDMATLQESRKVVQNRRVMPPDESLSVFDDWDI